MSKDKGTKNQKKPKADKSKSQDKSKSAYQSESKTEKDKKNILEPFVPKTTKGDGKAKNN